MSPRLPRFRPRRTFVIATCTAALVAGVSATAVARAEHTGPASADAVRPSVAFGHVRRHGGTGSFSLRAASPAPGARGVPGTTRIVLRFSAAVAAHSPRPAIAPAVPGRWSARGRDLVFVPATGFVPLTSVRITVPGGARGVRAASGARLATRVRLHFSVGGGSVLRIQQLLSLLFYSPLSWKPAHAAPLTLASENSAMFAPPKGRFAWRESGWPLALRRLWHPGIDNVFTRGLIMAFQADHGLTSDGTITSGLWLALRAAVTAHARNRGGYNFAFANQREPQTFTLWHAGRVVLSTAMNSGIAASPTANGTFPVYLRYRSQIMRGTNPNGSHYADPVQFVAYFNGGDAVHYMDRSNYGIPQSLGCLELPYAAAAKVWPYLAYGTLVTVAG